MPSNIGGFGSSSKQNFNNKSFGRFDDVRQFQTVDDGKKIFEKYAFTPIDQKLKSRIRFYDYDSLWSRWRRGYELYTITQSVLGSFENERSKRGDFRIYCSFQQYPGVFVPARIFTYPTTDKRVGDQIVAMRDANGFNFHTAGLPIRAVRYLGNAVNATYSQSGTTIVITKSDHGLLVNESVYLDILTGAGVDATLTIVATTQNTFTLTASSSATTSGNLIYYLSAAFTDARWTSLRVQLDSIPTAATFFTGERLVDRVVEKDPGLLATYSRTAGTVTITCSAVHGLSTGNRIFVSVSSGAVASGQYIVTVISSTQLQITTIASGTTSGNLTVSRLIAGYRYDDYVGYTVTGLDATTNEIIFQREDSYGTVEVNSKYNTVVPAQRGFEVDRFLTTDLRWQCSCQDFLRRDGYDFYSKERSKRFPVTNIESTKPGQVLNSDNSLSDERDIPGVFSDLGYTVVNNFGELPSYQDTAEFSYPGLEYYQIRWCKHIYASMFSLVHDEGSEPIAVAATYIQSGPNITVSAVNHELKANTKVQLDFTSGNAISGQYTITSVPSKDTFVVVYPFSEITSGYVTVSNLREHDFVEAWIREPNDKPVGAALDKFYKNFVTENDSLKKASERLTSIEFGLPFIGESNIAGAKNQPQQVANFNPELPTMFLTDNLRRDDDGALSRDGKPVNTSNRLLGMMSKIYNINPTQLEDAKFGYLDKPLINYVSEFESGLIIGGEYRNGAILETAAQTSTIDCSTYQPLTAQTTTVDSGLYIN